jgi:hypothetical protein
MTPPGPYPREGRGSFLPRLSRLRPEPALVRLGIGVAGLSALMLVVPDQLRLTPLGLGLFVALAAMPALLPDSWWPTVLALAAVAGWLASTTWSAQPVSVWRLLALSASLYLVHVLSALASVLPEDTLVAPDVIVRWLARALAVLVVASLLSTTVLVGTARVTTDGYQAMTVVGMVAAAALAGSLSLAARRLALR